jgi:hypothetical protein
MAQPYEIGSGQPPYWGPIQTTPGSSSQGPYTNPPFLPRAAHVSVSFPVPTPHPLHHGYNTATTTSPHYSPPKTENREELRGFGKRANRQSSEGHLEADDGRHIRRSRQVGRCACLLDEKSTTCELLSLHREDLTLICFLLARPRERCPITGLAANYLDPRTGIPYANVFAF